MRYKVYPIVLVFCVDRVCQTAMDTFEQSKTKMNIFEAICYHWAKNCYLISKKIINPALNNKNSDSTDPIVTIQYFLSSQQRNIIALNFYDDSTIIELYIVAKNETDRYVDASKSQLNTLSTACSTSENRFEKIMNILNELPTNSKVSKYGNQGTEYRSKLKRKYEDILSGLDNQDETLTSMEDQGYSVNGSEFVD